MAEKQIVWMGSSLDDLKGFPDEAKRNLGFQLSLLQAGMQPLDSKPMKTIASGVFELRVAAGERAYRTIYFQQLKDTIGVLNCFEKKSTKTPTRELQLARERLKEFKTYMKERARDEKA